VPNPGGSLWPAWLDPLMPIWSYARFDGGIHVRDSRVDGWLLSQPNLFSVQVHTHPLG